VLLLETINFPYKNHATLNHVYLEYFFASLRITAYLRNINFFGRNFDLNRDKRVHFNLQALIQMDCRTT
jgi:hypothetical protein